MNPLFQQQIPHDFRSYGEPVWEWFFALFLVLLFLWLTMRFFRRRRLLENLPTSSCKGIFMGLNVSYDTKSPGGCLCHF